MESLCTITDWELFSSIPETSTRPYQTKTLNRLEALKILHAANGSWAACLEVAARFAGEPGFAPKSNWKLYDRWIHGDGPYQPCDWRIVVDKNAGAKWQNRANQSLPLAFVQFVSSSWSTNQRDKFGSVWAGVVNQWRRWRSGDEKSRIPGYAACPPTDPVTDLPHGWTEGHLRRLCRPPKFARKLIQIGPKAAAQYGPMLLRTRVGLEVGQYYISDDYWNDFKVIPPGGRQACRILQLDNLDLFSACDFARGFKPAIEDEEGVKRGLKERDMVFLSAYTYSQFGYRPEGTTHILEAGTATMRDREIGLLYDLSRGKIIVHKGPCTGDAKLAGFFDGASGGNPRFKSPLESFWNLLHNRSGGMIEFPGQTGSNSRLNKPEEIVGRERHTVALLRAAMGMTAEAAANLAHDFLSSTDASFAINRLIESELINRRSNHSLEGWREAGLVVREWRPSTDWGFQSMASLQMQLADKSEAERAMRVEYLQSNPDLTREHWLSPREVFDAGRARLIKLPPAAAAIILNELEGTEVTVRSTRLSFMQSEINHDEPLHYEALRRDGMGSEELLQDGSKWLVRVNPLSPDRAFLYDAHNGFKGVCRNIARVPWDDVDGMARQFGRNKHIEAALLRDAARLAAPLLEAENARRKQNACVLASGLSPREDRASAKATASAAAFGAAVERISPAEAAHQRDETPSEQFDCRPVDSEPAAETSIDDVEVIDAR